MYYDSIFCVNLVVRIDNYDCIFYAGNVYKFKAPSVDNAEQWLKQLRPTVRGVMGKKPIPTNLMSFE